MQAEEKDKQTTGESQILYINTDNNDLHFPAKQAEENISGYIQSFPIIMLYIGPIDVPIRVI